MAKAKKSLDMKKFWRDFFAMKRRIEELEYVVRLQQELLDKRKAP